LTDAPRSPTGPAGIATLRGADPTAITPNFPAPPGAPPPGLRPPATPPAPIGGDSDATYIVAERGAARPAALPARAPSPSAPVQRPGRSPLPLVAAGLGALVVAGGVAWYVIKGRTPVVTTSLPPPETTPSSIGTTLPAVPSPVPPPSFEPAGKAAGAIRAAQAAFIAGDYERAVREAQSALKQDPGSAEARRLLDNALQGQAAAPRLQAAEAALGQGDHERALQEAQAAQALAPWDTRIPAIIARARAAQQQQQAKAIPPVTQPPPPTAAARPPAPPNGQINALLSQGDNALAANNYDGAIALYDEALRLDPANARAGQQKAAAIAARAIAHAAAQARGRTFVAGKTVATHAEPKGNLPSGFEDTPNVTLGRSQAAATPGRIFFDVEPEQVKAGDRYKVRVSLLNEGTAPIQIRDMMIGTRINGRGVQGPVAPMVQSVAPQQKALLREFPDFWKDDTSTWSMEVTVRTVRGETYKNEVTWK
jgi:tetratricopeptide (TPR) repeat protein